MFRPLVRMRTWLLSECVLVSEVACVFLMDEMGCFEFWSFYADTQCYGGYTLLQLMVT
jgi:hypothetical protein